MIPDILFALGRDDDLKNCQSILKAANEWLTTKSNHSSPYFEVVQDAKCRLATRVVCHILAESKLATKENPCA